MVNKYSLHYNLGWVTGRRRGGSGMCCVLGEVVVGNDER